MKAIYSIAAAALAFSATSCVDDLDVTNIDPSVVSNPDAASVFNKCYATLGLAGQSGPDGDCDIDGLDGGTTGFVRQLINSQCITSDELICCWGDPGIPAYNYNQWGADHPMLKGFYYRLYFGITMDNHYLENFAGDATKDAEVRFLRALHYYYLMDGWGNVPFKTTVTTDNAPQYTREQIFNFVETELLECEKDLSEAKAKSSTDEGYGRADKAAAWLLLARLYLNAETFIGTDRSADALTYAKKVMDSDYALATERINEYSAYQTLFMGDNGETAASHEIILPVLQDGATCAAYCSSMFAIAATFKSDMYVCDALRTGSGCSEGWSGNRCRKDLITKFISDETKIPADTDALVMVEAAGDDRALFWGKNRTLDINANDDFAKGYSTVKFNNFYATGGAPHDSKFVDMDWPLLRKAEAYLIYAEASARQNGGLATADGLAAINTLRARAKASNLSSANLDVICDEWSREFYGEGYRRSTLIRFGKFGGNTGYTWQWKGGSHDGQNFSENLNLFAIPETDLNANANLVQNPGF